MKKIVAFIAFVLVVGIEVNAQNSGFMGKYCIIKLDVPLSPSWNIPNPVTKYDVPKYWGLNYILSPNVECIIWRKGTLGVGYNFYQTPFDNSAASFFTRHDGSNGTYKGDITAHGFKLFYKQYLGKTVAPLGQYLKFDFDAFFYDYKAVSIDNPTYSYETTKFDFSGKDKLYGFKVEYGFDLLFFNCLVLSTGVSVGTTFGGFKSETYCNSNNQADLKNFVENNAKHRVLKAYWFGIKVGIGFIIF